MTTGPLRPQVACRASDAKMDLLSAAFSFGGKLCASSLVLSSHFPVLPLV